MTTWWARARAMWRVLDWFERLLAVFVVWCTVRFWLDGDPAWIAAQFGVLVWLDRTLDRKMKATKQ
jgi:hypothetical protein